MKIVVDSYAWIEIFLGGAKGESAKKTIETAEIVFTPDVVLAEIARKYFREKFDERTIRERLSTILEASELIGIDYGIAIETGKLFVRMQEKESKLGLKKPSLFDAIILAAAKVNEAKVVTGDEHFKDLPETVWLG